MASRQMDLIFKGVDQASGAVNSVTGSVHGLAAGVSVLSADVLVRYAKQLAETTYETVKLGAQSLAARDRLVAFAGGAEQADEMLAALNRGSDNTIDRMTATAQAAQMLSTGMASTAWEMEMAGAIVSKLGNQTKTTESRMQSLTMLLANQSTRRLDDFGLSVERVTARQKALEKQGLSTEQAFKTAVFEIAAEKLGVLGNTVDTAATQVAGLEAAWHTHNQALAESITLWLTATGILPTVTKELQLQAEYYDLLREAKISLLEVSGTEELAIKRAIASSRAWQGDEEELRQALEERAAATREAAQAAKELEQAQAAVWAGKGPKGTEAARWLAVYNVTRLIEEQARNKEIEELAQEHQGRLADIYRSGQQSLTQVAQEAHQVRLAALQDAMRAELATLAAAIAERNWQQQLRDMATGHQDRLNEIRARGAKTATDIETERYQDLLSILDKEQRARLAALRAQYGKGADPTAKRETLEEEHNRRMMGLYTKSARQKEEERYQDAIKELEYENAEAALLEQFQLEKEAAELAHAQALAKIKQAEIDASIQAENARYNRQVQQAVQAHNQQLTDDANRRAIEEKYAADQAQLERDLAIEIAGIEAAALAARIVAEQAWFAKKLGELQTFTDTATARAAANPIKIPVQLTSPIAGEHWETYLRRIGIPGFAAGGVSSGGLAIVGEQGPEMLNLPAGTRVTPMSQAGVTYVKNYFGAGSVRSDRDIRRIAENQERSLRLHGAGVVN